MSGLGCCSGAASAGLAAYALEADPGKLTASHPLFCGRECAERVATAPAMHREGLPPVRVLVRVRDGGPWQPA